MKTLTKPPCYNTKTNTDCINRKECALVGRLKCKKWCKYEKIHALEKKEINDKKEQEFQFSSYHYDNVTIMRSQKSGVNKFINRKTIRNQDY